MPLDHRIILACWLLFIVYWGVKALGVKKARRDRAWRREVTWRLVAATLVVLALQFPPLRQALRHPWATGAGASGLRRSVGVALCAGGVGLAIWARACLGRNWGMPMSRKEDPELITSGPYAWVRHPIYTGMLLALLGSAVDWGAFWSLAFVGALVYFLVSARTEEKLLAAQFPEQYPAYRQRTWMLVPFLL